MSSFLNVVYIYLFNCASLNKMEARFGVYKKAEENIKIDEY